MKRSGKVTLTVVAVVGMASCNRRAVDPCTSASFNEQACEEAVRSGGYFWNGAWIPMTYHYPYPYYYDSYRRHVAAGHVVHAEPGKSYGRPAAAAAPGSVSHPSSPGVVRGGFGSVGAGHGVGA